MRYLIIPSSMVIEINFGEVRESNPTTLRYNVDNTKTFIKWLGEDNPECVNTIVGLATVGLGTYWGPYSREEFNTVMLTEEWVGVST